jgi:hypothetical protein
LVEEGETAMNVVASGLVNKVDNGGMHLGD